MRQVGLPRSREDGDRRARNVGLLTAIHAQDSFEFVREHFDEARLRLLPVAENPLGAVAGSQLQMAHQEISDNLHIRLLEQGFEIDRVQIAALLGEIPALVENISDATAHAGGEISTAGAKHEHDAVGHVLAAVVAHALDDRSRSRIADGEAFAGDSVEEGLAASRAIKGDVADDDIFFRGEA